MNDQRLIRGVPRVEVDGSLSPRWLCPRCGSEVGPLDPDPRVVLVGIHHADPDDYARAFNAGFDEAWAQRMALGGFILAGISGAIAGAILTWLVSRG